MTLSFVTVCLLLVLVHHNAVADDDIIVQLPDGTIRGHVLKSAANLDFYAFQEIPYAAPPVGNNRYLPPKDAIPWTGILNATKNEKICIQTGMIMNNSMTQSEDCLFLNVYTPLHPSNISNPLPVYVWIHGGAFMSGSGASYGPEYLLDYEIVVVTINYRLGVKGFLSSLDGVISGNFGLKDQRKALRWVKANINLFGGDPDKITIGGESAGAHSVSYQILNQNEEDLFRGAIQESGSALDPTGYSKHARLYAYEVGQYLDETFTTSNSSSDLLQLLQNASVEDLSAAANKVTSVEYSTTGYVGDMIWTPVVEENNDDDPFLSSPMHESLINGNFHQVPVLLGFNSEESLFFMFEPDDLAAVYDANVSTLITDRLNIPLENVSQAATELKELYTNTSFSEDQAAFVRLSTDGGFTTGIIRQAECSSKYVPVYLYKFSYAGDIANNGYPMGRRPEVPGAEKIGHTEDLYYIWNLMPLPEWNDDDIFKRQQILQLMTNFIKYSNPTPEEDELLQNIIWPTVQPDNLLFLNIDTNLEIQNSPRMILAGFYIFWHAESGSGLRFSISASNDKGGTYALILRKSQ